MKPDLSWLTQESLYAFDTETFGLEETDRPFGIGFAGRDREEFYDTRIYPTIWQDVQPFFNNPHITWLAQNFKFDKRMIGYMGVTIAGTCIDINSVARIVRNDHFVYSLDAQAKRELGVTKDKGVEEYIKKHKLYNTRHDFFGTPYKTPAFDQVPHAVMEPYGKKDPRLTYDLYINYKKKLEATDQVEIKRGYEDSRRLMQQESDLIKVCYKMERRGLLVNKEYTLRAMYFEMGEVEKFKTKYMELTGVEFTDSAKSVQKNISIQLPQTEAGNPSLTDDVVDWVLDQPCDPRDKEIVETVRSIRGYAKRISTYYKSYLNSMTKENIIHPTMWIAGTTTGRFSYSDPNFQNMPKEEKSKDEFVVRACIKPRPGRVFVSLDYSQLEYRMAVAYANQSDVIDRVLAGADFHQATADLLGITRSQAKTLNFAVLYGAGIDKIAGMLGCTRDEAAKLQYRYFAGLPKVEKFIDRVIATGKGNGYVVNWMGRRLHAHKEFCYALPNHLIQGGGADVCKKAMVEIDKEFPDLMMVLQVHDQLVFELTEEELVHVPRIKEIMESVWPPMNGMILRTDVKISRTSLAERDMEDYVIAS